MHTVYPTNPAKDFNDWSLYVHGWKNDSGVHGEDWQLPERGKPTDGSEGEERYS